MRIKCCASYGHLRKQRSKTRKFGRSSFLSMTSVRILWRTNVILLHLRFHATDLYILRHLKTHKRHCTVFLTPEWRATRVTWWFLAQKDATISIQDLSPREFFQMYTRPRDFTRRTMHETSIVRLFLVLLLHRAYNGRRFAHVLSTRTSRFLSMNFPSSFYVSRRSIDRRR